jgi:hypothetical protein
MCTLMPKMNFKVFQNEPFLKHLTIKSNALLFLADAVIPSSFRFYKMRSEANYMLEANQIYILVAGLDSPFDLARFIFEHLICLSYLHMHQFLTVPILE